MSESLLKVEGVKKYYSSRGFDDLVRRRERYVKAVDGVSFEIKKGEDFGLVGESGCGKSTLCRLIARLVRPTEGTIKLEGKDVYSNHHGDRLYFPRNIQMVFQASGAALNPRQRIGAAISQPAVNLGLSKSRQETRELVLSTLEEVGLTPSERFLTRYPHELSGGQKQRACIARAIISNPKLILADEPVSSLDVSLKGQILSLMRDIRSRIGTTYLFVSHDLAIVANICKSIAVMYRGRIVELAETRELLSNPLHPYTRSLLSSYPTLNHRGEKRDANHYNNNNNNNNNPLQTGLLPSTPPGCRFRDRCPSTMLSCSETEPPLLEVGPRHYVACLMYDPGQNGAIPPTA